MRLLKYVDGKISLTKDLAGDIPQYAILSHTWGPDEEEVTYQDLVDGTGAGKIGYEKIRFCAQQAARDSLQYFWIDTCCIDKADHTELQKAINSMFRWYQNAAKCYVYLVDVSFPRPASPSPRIWDRLLRKKRWNKSMKSDSAEPPNPLWELAFRNSRWFKRGWTLQELLAPNSVEFFAKGGYRLGDKSSLEQQIYEITSIPITALRGASLSGFDVEERFRWTASRQAKYDEDLAYCLLGIFGVFMPLIYGEGKDHAMKRLRKELETRDNSSPRPFVTIPFCRDPNFVNRGDILDQVSKLCDRPIGRAALVGLGGVGKSQLAIEFAYRAAEATACKWVFWVHAGTRARIDEGFRAIADAVKIPGREHPQANIPQLIYSWLSQEENGDWVMLIDGADDANIFYGAIAGSDGQTLASYLPQSQNASIVITTRNKDLARRLTGNDGIIEVGAMASGEALSLLQIRIGPITDLDMATELVRTLEYIPLAINQAAGYIQARAPRSSVEKYLADFRESEFKRTKLLGHDAGDIRRDGGASNAVLTTWQLSFEHIYSKRRSAADLLSLMSFFDRQGIPESLLKPIKQTIHPDQDHDSDSDGGDHREQTSSEFEDDIEILKDFCLLSINESGSEFEMHKLVQLSTRKWLEDKDLEEDFKEQYLKRLGEAFPRGDYEYWEVCRKLFSHVEVAIEYKPTRKETEGVWATLLFNGAWYARLQGRYDVGERMAYKAKRSREKLLGTEDANTLSSISQCALLLVEKGQWAEAEELLVKLIEVRERKLGKNHLDTLSAIANLASVYKNQGQWNKAEELYVEVIEAGKEKLGTDCPVILTTIANLAVVYKNQGRWDKAEELIVEVIEVRKEKFGTDHRDTLIDMGHLALIYRHQGQLDKAEELEVKVVELLKRKLGADHPDTLSVMNNLAMIWKDQNRHEDALQLMQSCAEARQRVLGPHHPYTLNSLTILDKWMRADMQS